jgi:hypothetical protein
MGQISQMYMGISTPFTMYVANGNWCGQNNTELWNKGNTLYTMNNNSVYKTIYDPLPFNYKLPCPAAFSGFSSGSSGYNKGNYFYTGVGGNTIFIPSIGDRKYADGSIQEYDLVGDYLTSGPANSNHSIFLYSTQGTTRVNEVNCKAFAFPIMGVR